MDEPQSQDAAAEPWSASFDQALAQQRARVQEYVEAQRSRLRDIEGQVEARFEEVFAELDHERESVSTDRADLTEQTTRLAEARDKLQAEQHSWAETQAAASTQQQALAAQLEQREAQLRDQAQHLSDAGTQLRADQAQLAEAQQELELARAEIARQRKRLTDKQTELDERQERLDELEEETRNQRRRIARELREQKAAALEEIEHQRERLEEVAAAAEGELQTRLLAAQREMDTLRQTTLQDRETFEQTLAALETVRQRDAELESELSAALQSVADFERHALAAAASEPVDNDTPGPLLQELDNLRRLNETLSLELDSTRQALGEVRHELVEARQAAAAAPQSTAAPIDDAELRDMRRRYEMAMEDVRELRAEKSQLEAQLRSGARSAPAIDLPAEAMDWESQKRRLLASLESDYDPEESSSNSERLRIEEAIRRTDRVVHEKDQLITQLQDQLAEHSKHPPIDPAVAAAIDADEAVRAERTRLEQLQSSWEEKLRQAEIDLSVERAKIARQRADLEEKMRDIEAAQPKTGAPGQNDPANERPLRGRWLARLGLRDDDQTK